MRGNVPLGDEAHEEGGLHVCSRPHHPPQPHAASKGTPSQRDGPCQRHSGGPGAQNRAWVRGSVASSAKGGRSRDQEVSRELRVAVAMLGRPLPAAPRPEPLPGRSRFGGEAQGLGALLFCSSVQSASLSFCKVRTAVS